MDRLEGINFTEEESVVEERGSKDCTGWRQGRSLRGRGAKRKLGELLKEKGRGEREQGKKKKK